MKKIAVASENNQITQHFGHCANFNIYDVENNAVVKAHSVPNPGHKKGFLPRFINDLGVNVVISGGMGQGAVDLFNANNIEVILGASGKAEDAVNAYLQGRLESSASICTQHQHRGSCGEH